jgi:enoyl-CoA hydratase/carnithine racemase
MTETIPKEAEAGPAGQTDAGAAASTLSRETVGGVAVLTMHHAPHNLLGERLVAELFDGLDWARESGARCLIIRSSLRHFSAGAEMEAFESHKQGKMHSLPLVELLRAFDELPIPIVAAVNGVCVGGGFELALACDFVIAGEGAKIGSVEATLGLIPLMGAIQRVAQRAGAARAKEMAMLARRYDARTLERWNIINRVVPNELLADTTMTIAQELANGPSVAHAAIKRLVSIAVSEGVAAADEAMAAVQLPIWSSEDLALGIASLNASGPGNARFQGR